MVRNGKESGGVDIEDQKVHSSRATGRPGRLTSRDTVQIPKAPVPKVPEQDGPARHRKRGGGGIRTRNTLPRAPILNRLGSPMPSASG